MNNTRQTGRQGENAACDWLTKQGYTIVQKNYTSPHGEIDIIAEDNQYIIFVEVKYRKNSIHLAKYGRPIKAITKKKKEHVIFTAKHYLRNHPSQKKPRIDAIEIVSEMTTDGFVTLQIKHFKNAFGG